jgi:dTDP-4-dehydrorhamnose 3,5-epimerase
LIFILVCLIGGLFVNLGNEINLTTLKEINGDNGSVIRGLRKGDLGYAGIGEVYFSTVNFASIKGWKKHLRMTMNLIVVQGKVSFVFAAINKNLELKKDFIEITLSSSKLERLTVPPNIWMAFRGLSDGSNTIVNLASIVHDPNEQLNKPLHEIDYNWKAI